MAGCELDSSGSDRERWYAVMSMVMNLWVPKNLPNLTSWGTIRLWKALLSAVGHMWPDGWWAVTKGSLSAHNTIHWTYAMDRNYLKPSAWAQSMTGRNAGNKAGNWMRMDTVRLVEQHETDWSIERCSSRRRANATASRQFWNKQLHKCTQHVTIPVLGWNTEHN
jgi:hypothetical protein